MIKLYPSFEEAFFVERDNRFVMQLKRENGDLIKAYIANPGRMEEFLTAGHPFYITKGNKGKYFYRVVSTTYQYSYILLDTIKVNALVEQLLLNDCISEFTGDKEIRREVTIGNSKFDFLIESAGIPDLTSTRTLGVLEVKSCSLCHRGIAMFPDAPTERGKRHLLELERLADNGYASTNLYLINHRDARSFMPNWHTDPSYAEQFIIAKKTRFLAYAIHMIDPVTVDPNCLTPVPVNFEQTAANCGNRGSYLLVFYNDSYFKTCIGALGEREFKKGYYVYVGSAMQGLEQRIKRHMKKKKKKHWHVDYIGEYMKLEKVFPIKRRDRIEDLLAHKMQMIAPSYVPGFGSTDTGADSHFFWFPRRPYRLREFLNLLLDARMLRT